MFVEKARLLSTHSLSAATEGHPIKLLHSLPRMEVLHMVACKDISLDVTLLARTCKDVCLTQMCDKDAKMLMIISNGSNTLGRDKRTASFNFCR